MNTKSIESKFAGMGARMKVREVPSRWSRGDRTWLLRNEPLRRGAGKPHLVEKLYRSGGETVHVCSKHPNGITPVEHKTLLKHNPDASRWGWMVMRRNPGVYARGAVRHSDHATIVLPFWHRGSNEYRNPEPHDGECGVPGLNETGSGDATVSPLLSIYAAALCRPQVFRWIV